MERTIPPRTRIKRADLILSGDWHLTEKEVLCRTDDFEKAQWDKVDFIAELQRKHRCPIVLSGDLFDHWKPSPSLLTKTIQHLPEEIYTIYGNHDLPQHNLELAYKCGINVLEAAGKLNVLPCTHWNQELEDVSLPILEYNRAIAIWHVMTYVGKVPWPGCTDTPANSLLKKYPQFDLIVTGHNHQTFVTEDNGRLLVNPGSITRQTAAQMHHKPCVFLYYADTNTIKQVFLPFSASVITRAHIDKQKEHDGRIEAFISRLNEAGETLEAGLDFPTVVERLMTKKVKPPVKEIVRKAIETENE